MKISFDVISDLELTADDTFDWQGKATSLYCIVAGNISNDPKIVILVLNHLSRFYQAIFYIPGYLEFENTENVDQRIRELSRYCRKMRNVTILHHHVVIIEGLAILAANGWMNSDSFEDTYNREQDILYLRNSIEKLQKHLDVKKILLVSSSVPAKSLYFGEVPEIVEEFPQLKNVLEMDTEKKVSNWIFGTYKKIVDTTIDNVNYLSNPYTKGVYWAKRVSIED